MCFLPKIMFHFKTGYTMYIPVYLWYIPCEIHVLAFLVAHPRLEASDRDFIQIFSVLDTDRPSTRGWGRPKFHNQVLISKTWLPLRELGPAPSAQPYSKASFCRLLYLCGIVEVALPSRKHGTRGTRPRRSSTRPT